MTEARSPSVVIRHAELDGRPVDLALADGIVQAIVPAGALDGVDGPGPDTVSFDARGGAVLPGLHDHHIHLLALAAARHSVAVGPPDVRDATGMVAALRNADRGGTWIRAVGYHESVAGDIDRHWLDATGVLSPMRVQHRSGAMWVLNSTAIAAAHIGPDAPAGVERDAGGIPTGRIYRADAWLRRRVPAAPLDLAEVGALLASYGVTGVADLTPTERAADVELLADAVHCGALPLRVTLTGGPRLPSTAASELPRGPVKIVVEDHALPSLDEFVDKMRAARGLDRAVAVHCVTREALLLALIGWQEIGAIPGDRIEHGAVVPPDVFDTIVDLGLTIVTQPAFVRERGDAYLVDVPLDEHPDLWRCATLLEHSVPVAGSTDAPYSSADPWRAMAAATDRRTAAGALLGETERVNASTALGMFLGPMDDPGRPRRIAIGAVADLCVLDAPLAAALDALSSERVAATFVAGRLTYRRDAAISS